MGTAAYGGAMLVRLLLAFLLASFAVPAAAAVPVCHGDTGMSTTHHPAPKKEAPAHVCVGCVPLADWLGPRIPPRILPVAAQPAARVMPLDLGGTIAPARRPPRLA